MRRKYLAVWGGVGYIRVLTWAATMELSGRERREVGLPQAAQKVGTPMDQRVTEQTLVSRLRLGDQSAMRELEATYGSKIYQLAMRYMRNHEDAEEVRQDVLLRVFQKFGAFRGNAALFSWIYRITFNTAMSRLRSATFRRPREVAEADLRLLGPDGAGDEIRPSWDAPDWSSPADDELYRGELRRRLVDALRGLPLIYRMPVSAA